ncbi:hypothetical protein OA005_02610 [Paracoccaceae bacterium]|nr:hypothetical protein [Paracoccaceae bacterium]
MVLENYGNWSTLGLDTKTAYITGLWDGYVVYKKESVEKQYHTSCSESKPPRVVDLVNLINILYKETENRKYSPAQLLSDKVLSLLC